MIGIAIVALAQFSGGTFLENLGQWESPARFVGGKLGGSRLFLERRSFWLQVGESAGGANLRFSFEASRDGVVPVGRERASTTFDFLLGRDPSRWRIAVPGFGRVVYEGLYPGVDLVVRTGGSVFEYDLELDPGADLSRVVLRVEGGCGPLRLDPAGELVIDTPAGAVRQPRPRAWEEGGGGARRPLACGFRILAGDRFGFEAPEREAGLPLVVDPQLLYSTFLGGNDPGNAFAADRPQAIAHDPAGFAVVAGQTESPNFPTTPGAFSPTIAASSDGFVTRLPLSGGPPTSSTFLGGNGYE